MDRPVRVLIADDQPRARHSLRSLLATWPGIEVVGEAADGQEAVQQAGACRPDVVLMDIRMPIMDGLTATRMIKDRWPGMRVVVLSMFPDHTAGEALAAGADAFHLKGKPAGELLGVILAGSIPGAAESSVQEPDDPAPVNRKEGTACI